MINAVGASTRGGKYESYEIRRRSQVVFQQKYVPLLPVIMRCLFHQLRGVHSLRGVRASAFQNLPWLSTEKCRSSWTIIVSQSRSIPSSSSLKLRVPAVEHEAHCCTSDGHTILDLHLELAAHSSTRFEFPLSRQPFAVRLFCNRVNKADRRRDLLHIVFLGETANITWFRTSVVRLRCVSSWELRERFRTSC